MNADSSGSLSVPDFSSAAENMNQGGEEENESSGEDDDEVNFMATQFSALEMESVPVIRYDSNGNEIDPLTGFPKPRHTLAQVLRLWKRNELTVSKSSVTRLLRLLHRYKPEISRMDYVNNKIPRKADTLLRIPESEHKYVIRDFDTYDYKLDEFPRGENEDDANEMLSFDDAVDAPLGDNCDVEDDDADSISTDDSVDMAIVDSITENNEYNRCIGVADDDRNSPEHYDDDIIDAMASDEENEVDRDLYKMVYFGLENILTCSNSAGNIQKGAYFNYLRAIALLDDNALTDDVVNRLFPKNSKVRSKI
jgi:hypothetical protein